MREEEKMWEAVIMQAMRDATGDRETADPVKRGARNWICQEGDDFKMVCDFAGANPKKIKEILLKFERSKK